MRTFLLIVLTLTAVLIFAVLPSNGEVSKAAWTAPRTPDGQPDLQGIWTNNTGTPLQCPKELGTKELYTEAVLAQLQKDQRDRLLEDYDERMGMVPTYHTACAV